jgi:hypothetical protein
MKEMGTLGVLLSVFIALIVGIAFLLSSANTVTDVTTIQSVTNSSIALRTDVFTNLTHVNTVAVSALRNCTNGTTIAPASYTFTAGSGIMTTTENFTAACVDYTFKGTNYVEDNSARAVINLIILLFALGIVGIGLVAIKPLIDEKFFK